MKGKKKRKEKKYKLPKQRQSSKISRLDKNVLSCRAKLSSINFIKSNQQEKQNSFRRVKIKIWQI